MSKLAIVKTEQAYTATLKLGRVHFPVPAVIAGAGERASKRFIEFFTVTIRNRNTRLAYARNCVAFLNWCEERRIGFDDIESITVSAYVEYLLVENKAGGLGLSKPTVKQHLAAIRMMLDWMVTGGLLPYNPAAAVRGPKYVIKKGKTPVLKPDEARLLLDSIRTVKIVKRKDGTEIEKPDLVGLRDRALLGVMVFSFGRVSAVVGMDVDDYYQQGKRWWLRLHEKGGKHHEVPVHHKAEEYLDEYIAAAGIKNAKGTPLWRSMTKERGVGNGRMTRIDVYRMIKRRCR